MSIENGSQFCKDKSNFGFLTVSKSLIWKFSYEKEFFSIIYRSQRKIEKDKNMTFLAWSRMRFSKIYTLHRISENRKSVSTARESRVHFFHEPFFCEHEWDSQKNKIFVHLHKQSVKSKFACALFPHPWLKQEKFYMKVWLFYFFWRILHEYLLRVLFHFNGNDILMSLLFEFHIKSI